MDARPFLPIHDDDTLYDNVQEELEEIVEDYMKEGNLLK
jgi:phage gpG-like protein